jgi:hypothetical protein
MYLLHFQPRNPYEADLVEQLVAARWRLDRVWSYETALLEVQIGRREPDIDQEFKSCSEEVRNALAFRSLYDASRVLSGLSRHESRFRKICDKIVKTLDALQENRKLYGEPSPTNGHTAPPIPPTAENGPGRHPSDRQTSDRPAAPYLPINSSGQVVIHGTYVISTTPASKIK